MGIDVGPLRTAQGCLARVIGARRGAGGGDAGTLAHVAVLTRHRGGRVASVVGPAAPLGIGPLNGSAERDVGNLVAHTTELGPGVKV